MILWHVYLYTRRWQYNFIRSLKLQNYETKDSYDIDPQFYFTVDSLLAI